MIININLVTLFINFFSSSNYICIFTLLKTIYFDYIVPIELAEQIHPQEIRQRYGLLGRWSEGGFY